MTAPGDPEPIEARRPDGATLRGEAAGGADAPALVLLHGLTATRRYVVHGSRFLPRNGFRVLAYDARGHGESDPAAGGAGYGYEELAGDLAAFLQTAVPVDRAVLVGHSMGAHTAVAHALHRPDGIAALVLIGPAVVGDPSNGPDLAYWNALADGLESGGVEGFIRAYEQDLDPQWRDVLLRIARERLGRHRHPEAVADALREVPRSRPFDGLAALERLDVPALVVASHDDADPGHPYAVAAEWAERLPRARLVSEEQGASPLAWQGGRLSRAIASFCGEPSVRERAGC